MSEPIQVMCFTDVLCVYCYVGDVRFEELKAKFRGEIELSYHFIPVYGDVRRRIARSGRTGEEYGERLRGFAEQFDHVQFANGAYNAVVPASSTATHLYLRAVKLLQDDGIVPIGDGANTPFERLMWATRVAFFRDLVDISRRENIDELARREGIDVDEVRASLTTAAPTRSCRTISSCSVSIRSRSRPRWCSTKVVNA